MIDCEYLVQENNKKFSEGLLTLGEYRKECDRLIDIATAELNEKMKGDVPDDNRKN